MPETAEQRREHARIANLHRQLTEPSGAAMTAAARRAAEDRFVAEVRAEHPDASTADLHRMADAKRKLFYAGLSAAGVAARQHAAELRRAEAAVRGARRHADRVADALTGDAPGQLAG